MITEALVRRRPKDLQLPVRGQGTTMMGQDEGGILKTAAKAIGKAAGKVVSITGTAGNSESDTGRPAAKGKLPRKNKERLPRRAKKAQKKRNVA
jgi:hypothetical protein